MYISGVHRKPYFSKNPQKHLKTASTVYILGFLALFAVSAPPKVPKMSISAIFVPTVYILRGANPSEMRVFHVARHRKASF